MMGFLKRPSLFTPEETAHIVEAIRAAEANNRGEVRVHVERQCPVNSPLTRAQELYFDLGMQRTADDTGVLLYVALESQLAAVFAGEGIFTVPRQGFWQEVIDAVADGYRRGDGIRGITAALGHIGALLRVQVPGDDSAGNELPDLVTHS